MKYYYCTGSGVLPQDIDSHVVGRGQPTHSGFLNVDAGIMHLLCLGLIAKQAGADAILFGEAIDTVLVAAMAQMAHAGTLPMPIYGVQTIQQSASLSLDSRESYAKIKRFVTWANPGAIVEMGDEDDDGNVGYSPGVDVIKVTVMRPSAYAVIRLF